MERAVLVGDAKVMRRLPADVHDVEREGRRAARFMIGAYGSGCLVVGGERVQNAAGLVDGDERARRQTRVLGFAAELQEPSFLGPGAVPEQFEDLAVPKPKVHPPLAPLLQARSSAASPSSRRILGSIAYG